MKTRTKIGWAVTALVVANEIRGVAVAVAVGWPVLKGMWGI